MKKRQDHTGVPAGDGNRGQSPQAPALKGRGKGVVFRRDNTLLATVISLVGFPAFGKLQQVANHNLRAASLWRPSETRQRCRAARYFCSECGGRYAEEWRCHANWQKRSGIEVVNKLMSFDATPLKLSFRELGGGCAWTVGLHHGISKDLGNATNLGKEGFSYLTSWSANPLVV